MIENLVPPIPSKKQKPLFNKYLFETPIKLIQK